METITKEEFQKRIAHMYGQMTCFLYNTIKKYCVVDEVGDKSLEYFLKSDFDIEVCSLKDDSETAEKMLSKWIRENSPCSNVQDDSFMPIIWAVFSEESKLYIAKRVYEDSFHYCYMLVYPHFKLNINEDMTTRTNRMAKKLSDKGYKIQKSITGYYMMFDTDGNTVADDPACEDYYDYDSSVYMFYIQVFGD